MDLSKVTNKFFLVLIVSCFCILSRSTAQSISSEITATSTTSEALSLIEKVSLKQSAFWPLVKPEAFLNNLRQNILHPLDLYEGSFTNFCGYAALTYLPLHDDPKTYTQFMLELYEKGGATYRKVLFDPSKPIKNIAGNLHFKGKLDVRPADQMWFLSLADHFKGYINFFNKKYKPGAENTFWASVNYGKFNNMIRQLFNYNLNARGSDLMHPGIHNLVDYIQSSLKTGTTFLYLNNAYLLKKNENIKPGIPTHYIVLLNLVKESNGSLTMTYWDYGYRSLRQLSPAFLKRIVFGITHCTLKQSHNE